MRLVVLDLETTGLDPKKDHILEVAAKIVEVGVDGVVDETESTYFSKVAHFGASGKLDVNPYVLAMHTKNGLWGECEAKSACSVREVDAYLCAWLTAKGLTKDVILAGNSIHFDRSFLSEEMPATYALLSHRMVDVSALVRFAKACGHDIEQTKDETHRALGDVDNTIADMKKVHAILVSTLTP